MKNYLLSSIVEAIITSRRRMFSLSLPLFLAAAVPGFALADDTFSQSGTFMFQNTTGDPYHPNWAPVDITFPQEFGSAPDRKHYVLPHRPLLSACALGDDDSNKRHE